MAVKIIFVDVDGTLFNDTHRLTALNRQVCIQAQKQGIHVIINTGRIITNAVAIAKQIDSHKYHGFAVGNNGVHIYSFKDEKIIYSGNMANVDAKAVYNWADNKGFKCQLYTEDSSYVNQLGENSSYWADVMQAHYNIVKNIDDVKKTIARIVIIAKEITTQQLSSNLIKEFNHKFKQLEIKEYRPGIYEVTIPGMSKGFAVKYICDLLKIKLEDAMAFGDSYNDQWLLEAVGHPIAMENAVDALKNLSNYICQNNNENGVGNHIMNKVLNN